MNDSLWHSKDWEAIARLQDEKRRAVLRAAWERMAQDYPRGDFDRLISMGAGLCRRGISVDALVIGWALAQWTPAAADVAANVLAGCWRAGPAPLDTALVKSFLELWPLGEDDEQVRYDLLVVAHALGKHVRVESIRVAVASAVQSSVRRGFRAEGFARAVAQLLGTDGGGSFGGRS